MKNPRRGRAGLAGDTPQILPRNILSEEIPHNGISDPDLLDRAALEIEFSRITPVQLWLPERHDQQYENLDPWPFRSPSRLRSQ